jgi:RNA-directed DNA polymerase
LTASRTTSFSERWLAIPTGGGFSCNVERWVKAPLQLEDGSLVERDRGTPRGSAISPLLANMFLHYAFDAWMAREHRLVLFERYCDDVIVQARSEQHARESRAAIASRLAECGLQLNEHKTRIVYCKDWARRGSHEHERFDFLGYTFRPRLSRSKSGGQFVNFLPAVSDDARKRLGRQSTAGACTVGRARPSRTGHGRST